MANGFGGIHAGQQGASIREMLERAPERAQSSPPPMVPPALHRLDGTLSFAADVAERAAKLSAALCGPCPLPGCMTDDGSSDGGLFGAADMMIDKIKRHLNAIDDELARIFARLP